MPNVNTLMTEQTRYNRSPLMRLFGQAAQTLVLLLICTTAMAQHGQVTPLINDYFKMVFSGNLSGATELIESNPQDHAATMIKDNFQSRFVDRTSSLDLSSLESPVARQVAELFQAYWRDALLQVKSIHELESTLKQTLDRILVEQGFDSAVSDEDTLLEHVEALFRKEGYFALSGRTPPLLELMIWTQNETKTHDIELTDGTYQVDVNYLDEFISYGWSNFASFGMTSTGGWAKEDGLYCLCAHYNLNSERFKLSFLKHEGRHFADFKRYPELEAADLEYRAKLTELAYVEEGRDGLLEHFINSANRIADAPHPLANWYVVNRLSERLFNGTQPTNVDDWKSVPLDTLHSTALLLLEEHDQALIRDGAMTTTGVIVP